MFTKPEYPLLVRVAILTCFSFLSSSTVEAQCESEWATQFSPPGLSGPVFATVVFDDGFGPALFVGGSFEAAGGMPVGNIAKWDGSSWSSLGATPGVSAAGASAVYALAVYDDGGGAALYAGGLFESAGGAPASNIAKWNGTSWSALGTGIDGGVYALTAFESELYAGGTYSNAGGQSASNIARWNGTSWSALTSGTNGPVDSLAVFNLQLYMGGQFSMAGGANRDNIAKWNGSSWAAIGGAGSHPNGRVRSLTVYNDGSGSRLYLGGDFTSPGLHIANYTTIANEWNPVGTGMGGPAPTVYALGVYNGQLYAGGSFSSAGGNSASNIARWNGSFWSPLGSGVSGTVYSLNTFDPGLGPRLFVGGYASPIDSPEHVFLSSWNGNQWSGPPHGQGLDGTVHAFATFDDGNGEALYAGGDFLTAGSTGFLNNIARWDGSNWTRLGIPTSGVNGTVYAMVVFDDGGGEALFVGGLFTMAGGAPANNIAKWDGSNWSALISGTNGLVYSLAVFDDGGGPALYAGGSFSSPANQIAKWNGSSWASLGSGISGPVISLAVFNDGGGQALYAGGSFGSAGGNPDANYIAKWDGFAWSDLDEGMDNEVEAIAVFDDGSGPSLFASGDFSLAGNVSVSYIAKWNGSSWSGLGSGLNAEPGEACDGTQPGTCGAAALMIFDDGGGESLYAGGFFANAGDMSANHIAKWDGVSWSPVGSGKNGYVYALSVFDDGEGRGLFAGGDFTQANGNDSFRIARLSRGVCRVYVSAAATGVADGSSWADAYQNLQDALIFARRSRSLLGAPPTEIWVAKGTYYPDRGGGMPLGDRAATFQLLDDVALYGGFAGGETSLSQRNITANETILSGDLLGNDTPVACTQNTPDCDSFGGLCSNGSCIIADNNDENSYHVVTGSGTNPTALLDGFTLTAGNSNIVAHQSGAGLFISAGSPQVLNCRFSGNSALSAGSGIFNGSGSSTIIRDCTFRDNSGASGTIHNNNSSPKIVQTLFVRNWAQLGGAGIQNFNGSSPTIVNSRFFDNHAGDGGAIYNSSGSPNFIGCLFSGNVANNGGGVFNTGNTIPTIINCTFSANSAAVSGGGIFNNSTGNPAATNCVLWGNIDAGGSDESAQIHTQSGAPTVNFSIVQGGWTGAGFGNANSDPLFFDPDGVDGLIGTLDDDLRLRADSSAIDSGDMGALPPDTADVDNDGDTTETLPIDLAGNPRVTFVVFSNVDRGAYEYFPDCNNNGIDDTSDILNSTSNDCLRLSVIHDCCEIHGPGCSDAAVQSCVCKVLPSCCSTAWDAACVQRAENNCNGCPATNNGIPDECDLAQCTGDPGCDDCNLNGLLDGCDISDGDSDDVAPMDGIPDECSTFTGECTNQGQTQYWTCPANWDLGGDYPDDDDSAVGISVTLPEGLSAFLNETVVIPSLRLASGSQANVTQSGAQGDLYFSTPAMLNIEGHMHVSGDRNIGGAPGLNPTIVVGPDGGYEADHAAVAGGSVTATLTASNLSIIGSDCFIPPCPHGGEVILTDSMEIATLGELVVDGRYANGECELHRTGQTAALSFHTPPSIRVIGPDTRVIVGTNVVLYGAAGVLLESNQPLQLSGDWQNHSVRPDCFHAETGIVRLDGPDQGFEVAATDTGGQGTSADNFRIGTLEIAGGSTLTLNDDFDNDLQTQASCGEAQYVDTLVLEAGASLIAQNCRLYYNTLLQNPSSSIVLHGCSEVRATTNPDPLGADPSGLNKARAISFVPPAGTVAGGGQQSALRVKLTSLHHVTPPYTGGPSIPFTSFEGQIRWVGPPTQYVESTSSGVPLIAASLQCSPYYHDWATIGLMHVFGNAIVPSSSYSVQAFAGSCDGIENSCTAVSSPLTITTTRWGDVENPFNPPSATVQPDVADIGALVNKFRSAPGAPIKARSLLAGAPGNPFGEITHEVLNVDLGFSHISACVDAFRGVPYPYTIQSCP